MAYHKKEVLAKCKACRGEGLYVGMAERDGAAVVCSSCKGDGSRVYIFEWEDFEGRQPPSKPIERVYEVNPGIVIGKGNGLTLEQFGGMSYEDWAHNKPFPPKSENRAYTCPAWWYQSADYEKKPRWKECGWGTFSSCQHFPTKSKCWERWDIENNL